MCECEWLVWCAVCSFFSCCRACRFARCLLLFSSSRSFFLLAVVCARGIIVAYEIETINFAHIEWLQWKVRRVLFIFTSISVSCFGWLRLRRSCFVFMFRSRSRFPLPAWDTNTTQSSIMSAVGLPNKRGTKHNKVYAYIMMRIFLAYPTFYYTIYTLYTYPVATWLLCTVLYRCERTWIERKNE